jgi:predicted phosphoserine aminotransferase
VNESGPGGVREPRGHFFLPGPTEAHPDVLAAQALPLIGHRGAQSEVFMVELQKGLGAIFFTDRPVFIGTTSATGFMEAGVRNAVRGRMLALVCGAFSRRFADIATSCGIAVDTLEVPWGESIDPDAVAAKLAEGGYDTVTTVHSETSTGVLNDIRAISEVVHGHDDTLLLVDSVSGFAGAEVRTDAWGIDFLLTGSQKALALPPGLAFGVASEAMMERAATVPNRGFYFDLLRYASNMEKPQSPTTPAISTLFALQVQLERIAAEGMEARWARHTAMAERTWAWVEEMRGSGVALSVMAPEGHRSPTVTAVMLPENISGPSVVGAMKERGWVIGGGYGKLKDGSFRIGHMGDHTMDELNALLAELTEVLS